MEQHLHFRLMLFHLGMEVLYACMHVCMDKLGFRPNLFFILGRERKNGHVHQRCMHMYDTTKSTPTHHRVQRSECITPMNISRSTEHVT